MIGTCVIVGAGLAEVNAAESLREQGFSGSIELIGQEPHLPYDRPVLSKQMLLGTVPPEELFLRDERFYADHEISLRLSTTATRLLPTERGVELRDGTVVRADAVVLATGGRARALPIPGAGLAGVHTLRTLDDAVQLRERLNPGARVVVIGGGFIGTEVAAAAHARNCDVVILEAAYLPLVRALGPELAQFLTDFHRSKGIVVHTSARIDRITGANRADGVELTDGRRIPAEVIVIGVGMTPSTELAAGAGLLVDDGIHVSETGQTSVPGVFAAGDVANMPSADGQRLRIEHWQNAIERGRSISRGLVGQDVPPRGVPWFWSDQHELNIQIAGHPDAGDDIVWRGKPQDRGFAVAYHRGGVLTGFAAVNSGRDIRPASVLIAEAVPVDVDQLADPSVKLRSLVRASAR